MCYYWSDWLLQLALAVNGWAEQGCECWYMSNEETKWSSCFARNTRRNLLDALTRVRCCYHSPRATADAELPAPPPAAHVCPNIHGKNPVRARRRQAPTR